MKAFAVNIPEKHCSRWSGIPQDKLKDYNRQHIGILVSAFRTGVYNLPINWKRVDWRHGPNGTQFFIGHSELATFDFDYLTRLVLAAHEECVRVSVRPHTFHHLKVAMWSGRKRGGQMHERHPTIEDAIAAFRDAYDVQPGDPTNALTPETKRLMQDNPE